MAKEKVKYPEQGTLNSTYPKRKERIFTGNDLELAERIEKLKQKVKILERRIWKLIRER